MIKVITNQDANYKWTSGNSGEASINLSQEIATLIAPNAVKGTEFDISLIVHKEDYLKALGVIANILPLYTTTSKKGVEVKYSNSLFLNSLNNINAFFGDDEEKAYSATFLYRADGRYYLKKLNNNGFNIRDYLVSYYSFLFISKKGETIDVRLTTGPLKGNINEMSKEERTDAFFEYIDKSTNLAEKTRSNYKKAAENTQTEGKPIQDNIQAMGLQGTLMDYTDLAVISLLHKKVLEDPNNQKWNYTCSSTVACYRDFILRMYENLKIEMPFETNTNYKQENDYLQQIFYGAPGTGKSHEIKDKTSAAEKEGRVFRTTFHPDSDYSTFVGCYKPTKEKASTHALQVLLDYDTLVDKFKEYLAVKDPYQNITRACTLFGYDYHDSIVRIQENNVHTIPELVADAYKSGTTYDSQVRAGMACYEDSIKPQNHSLGITYSFIPQSFTKAYLRAWQTTDSVYLIIEEINRGNCAQIFGDLFQLLDRGDNGQSEYPIKADNDLATYIGEQLSNTSREGLPENVKSGEDLMLPSNLYIWATMNTSDQSLFPIDSAFKRRWEWKYVPINNHEDKNYKIEIGTAKYDWWGFLSKINQVIGDTTSSEDKKLGYFFAKAKGNIIAAEQFVGKVLFYLWNDVFKNYGFDNPIFSKGDNKKFEFAEFFKQDGSPDTDMVNKFLVKLNETIDNENSFDETNNASNNEEQGE